VEASQIDLSRIAALIPEGVTRGSDLSVLTVGTVTGLDIPASRVQVTVSGSEPIWLPAAPFIYEPGAKVRLRRSALNGGRLEFCEGPIAPAAAVVTGKVTEITDETLTVDVLGAEWELGYTSSTYDLDETVAVLRHPTGFGVPQWVLGIAGKEQVATNPGGGAGNPGQAQARQATISPQDSGSYKVSGGRWDSWNTNRYGGVRALWQGNQYGSGPMIGWAGYGDQVANLYASQITSMWVDVQRSDSSVSNPKAVALQGSPDGARPGGAPGGAGDTAASPGLPPEGGARILLPASSYEAWRTGGIKGLRTAGGDYLALYGADRGGAMTLTVQYTVVA
jgi:hypothetical protein